MNTVTFIASRLYRICDRCGRYTQVHESGDVYNCPDCKIECRALVTQAELILIRKLKYEL